MALRSKAGARRGDGRQGQTQQQVVAHQLANTAQGDTAGRPVLGGDGLAQGRQLQQLHPQKQRQHGEIQAHHDLHIFRRAGKTGKTQVQQADAADRQQPHGQPDPEEEAAQHLCPQGQPGRRLQAANGSRTENHPGEEHAAHPDQGGEGVQGIEQGVGGHG